MRLVRYGEIRTVTLGTSPGVGESGPSGTRFKILLPMSVQAA